MIYVDRKLTRRWFCVGTRLCHVFVPCLDVLVPLLNNVCRKGAIELAEGLLSFGSHLQSFCELSLELLTCS